ncbi:MAG: RDD family protein [Acidobacteriota bacterium]
MSLKEQFIAKVEHKIIAPRELKDRLIGDLLAHFSDGAESGESEADVIRKLGNSDDIATEFMANIQLKYAGFWIRVAAYIVDLIIISLPVLLFLGLIAAQSSIPTGSHQGIVGHSVTGLLALILAISFAIFIGAFVILYFPLLEGLYGRTLGKRLFRLRVVRDGGVAIGMKEAFLRRISMYIKILTIDALFIPFNAKKQRAFDMVAKTVVIYEPGV